VAQWRPRKSREIDDRRPEQTDRAPVISGDNLEPAYCQLFSFAALKIGDVN